METWDSWAAALRFLFLAALQKIDMGPLRLTADEPEVTVAADPRFMKKRVTITFWVERS